MSETVKRDLHLIRRILLVFRPYLGAIALVLVSIIATTLLSLVNAAMIRAIFDDAIAGRNLDHLVLFVGIMFLAPVIGNIISIGRSLLSVWIGQNIVRNFRIQLYAHLQRMSLRFYTSTHVGEIQSRLTGDINGIQGIVTNTGPSVIGNLATVIGLVVGMAYISPALTVLSLVFMPAFLLVNYRVGKTRRSISRERQEAFARISSLIAETLTVDGMLLQKTFGRHERASEQFGRHSGSLVALEMRQHMASQPWTIVSGVIFAALPALIYLVAGWQMISGLSLIGTGMTAGSLIAFTALQARFFAPVSQLFLQQGELHAGLALFDRIFEYLDLPVEIVEQPGALTLEPQQVRGKIEYAQVAFSYPERPRGARLPANPDHVPKAGWALQDISFTVEPGKMVALVGASGAGKTSMAYMLPRFYDVSAGAVMIDGHDVRSLTLASLSSLVGIVTQETYLLHASVRENLLYARPKATDEEMIAAARAAAIHDRIMEWEAGYDTVIGERGYKLSGGEKQRIAIARILLKNPPILVLDEATSALDTQSERLVQGALERLLRGRTTLVIAHRLSTIVAADTIIVMERGRIVEQGTHLELLARNGRYAQRYQEQFRPLD